MILGLGDVLDGNDIVCIYRLGEVGEGEDPFYRATTSSLRECVVSALNVDRLRQTEVLRLGAYCFTLRI